MAFNKNKKNKDFNYFDFFIRVAENACQAAEHLHRSLLNFDRARITELVEEMHEIEHRADSEKHEMTAKLIREFLPPIEREDIASLAHQLDNVVDSIDDVMLRIDMCNVSKIVPDALTFTDLIMKCCSELLNAMTEFKQSRTSKELSRYIVAVNSLESEGDKLHTECLRALYTREDVDAKVLLAWTGIYDELENCLDACENCTDIIEMVIMKNS